MARPHVRESEAWLAALLPFATRRESGDGTVALMTLMMNRCAPVPVTHKEVSHASQA